MGAKVIAQRSFSLEDLQWFAAASGDWNPIHTDPVAARRLLAGEVVVHGMFTLLWALDAYCATGGTALSSIIATFPRPVLIGDKLALTREQTEQDAIRLMIQRAGEVVATILLTVGDGVAGSVPVLARPTRALPEAHAFADIKGATGRLPVMALPEDMLRAFPSASAVLGRLPVAALMGLSRLVGMHCPGLHSLFAGVDLRLDTLHAIPGISWQVVRHTVPHAPLRIAVEGGSLSGRLEAFVRPEPVAQASMVEVAASVKPGSFTGQMALIVGGSRGLGELTAKAVAAGGGQVIITYASGKADAERVASEIKAWGGDCKTLELDVEQPDPAIATLRNNMSPTHLYYFAAPRIGRAKNGLFDPVLYRSFNQIFVTAFAGLVTALAKDLPGGLNVFYPSSVFLDELPREYAEYIAAKAAGEALCRQLCQHIAGLQILIRRLPRMPTDQTAGLIRRSTALPLPEILQVVQDMHALSNTHVAAQNQE